MNTLNDKKSAVLIAAQYSLLLFDICLNSFESFAKRQSVLLLILYAIQSFCLIITLTMLLVDFFSTYVFQAGLIQLLYTRFRATLVSCVIYLVLSVGLHTWHIATYWSSSSLTLYDNRWTVGFHCFYWIHRIVAVSYYYLYKRASLRIRDPRFYERSSWIQKQLSRA